MSTAIRLGIAGLAAYMVARAVTTHAPTWGNPARYGLAAAIGLAAFFAYPTVVEGSPIGLLAGVEDCGCGA